MGGVGDVELDGGGLEEAGGEARGCGEGAGCYVVCVSGLGMV